MQLAHAEPPLLVLVFGVYGLGVQGLGFRVWGFRVYGVSSIAQSWLAHPYRPKFEMTQILFLTPSKFIPAHVACKAGQAARRCRIIVSLRSVEMMLRMIGYSYARVPKNSQHCSRVIAEQRSFAVWRLAIAFARRRSSVASSECDDLHFDAAGNDSATINRYPTRRDYRKLLALPRTEKFSTFAAKPLPRVRAFRWRYCRRLEACRWRHRRRRVRSFSTDGAQKLLGGGDGTATPDQKLELVSGSTDADSAGSEAFRWVAVLTAAGQKLLGGGGSTATPGQKLVGAGTDGAWSEVFRWRH